MRPLSLPRQGACAFLKLESLDFHVGAVFPLVADCVLGDQDQSLQVWPLLAVRIDPVIGRYQADLVGDLINDQHLHQIVRGEVAGDRSQRFIAHDLFCAGGFSGCRRS